MSDDAEYLGDESDVFFDNDARAAALRDRLGIMSELDLSVMLDVTPKTLQNWRAGNGGPDYAILGRNAFYRVDDVQAWIKMNVTVTTRNRR